jgi:hypothetical protein
MGDLEGGSFNGDIERQVEKGPGNGASLSMGIWKGAFF